MKMEVGFVLSFKMLATVLKKTALAMMGVESRFALVTARPLE